MLIALVVFVVVYAGFRTVTTISPQNKTLQIMSGRDFALIVSLVTVGIVFMMGTWPGIVLFVALNWLLAWAVAAGNAKKARKGKEKDQKSGNGATRHTTKHSPTRGKGETMNDTIHFRCPSCGRRLKQHVSAVGRKGMCPGCGRAFVVPSPAETEHPPWEEAVPEKVESAAAPTEGQIESQEPGGAATATIELVDSQDVEPESTEAPPEPPAPSKQAKPVAPAEPPRGLNPAQMRALWVAAVLLVGMVLFPPWRVRASDYNRPGGYGLLFAPPEGLYEENQRGQGYYRRTTGIDSYRLTAQIVALCGVTAVAVYSLRGAELNGGFARRFLTLLRDGCKNILLMAAWAGCGAAAIPRRCLRSLRDRRNVMLVVTGMALCAAVAAVVVAVVEVKKARRTAQGAEQTAGVALERARSAERSNSAATWDATKWKRLYEQAEQRARTAQEAGVAAEGRALSAEQRAKTAEEAAALARGWAESAQRKAEAAQQRAQVAEGAEALVRRQANAAKLAAEALQAHRNDEAIAMAKRAFGVMDAYIGPYGQTGSAEDVIHRLLRREKGNLRIIGWKAERFDEQRYLVSYSFDRGDGPVAYLFEVNLAAKIVRNIRGNAELEKTYGIRTR